jgi:hypothetical protein
MKSKTGNKKNSRFLFYLTISANNAGICTLEDIRAKQLRTLKFTFIFGQSMVAGLAPAEVRLSDIYPLTSSEFPRKMSGN